MNTTEKISFYDLRLGSGYINKYNGILATESIFDFCKAKEAWWLLDMVASYRKKLLFVPFAVITFIRAGAGGRFVCKEDTNEPELIAQTVDYTDLEVNVKFYLSGGVLMFPSDY